MASKDAPKETPLKTIAETILSEQLQRIIHNTIIHQHRAHKMLLVSLDPTTKLPHCDNCKLPRLLEPPLAPKVRGALTEPPRDTNYCELRPWSRRPGHDIYDNPFPKADATGRPPTKKEKEAAKAKNAEGTPASEEPHGTGPPSPSENGEQEKKLEKGEKKASKIDEKLKKGEYVPWHTCPSCKRSLLITRFAKHLEQCMGLSGRAASRNAMAKIQGTPTGSRAGTPGASQEGKPAVAGAEDEDEDDAPRGSTGKMHKKLLKKSLTNKMKKDNKQLTPTANGNGKVKIAPAKRPPAAGNVLTAARSSPAPSQSDKRDADEMLLGEVDDDEDTIHIKKRQKLSRISSVASIGSQQSTIPPGSAVLERGESVDGSFVGDADGDGEEGEVSE
ncbi:hypothetical protein LTR10_012329 [Elasticomyces elasticus]|nr:hypothetical protein LTR10_012329 [Elasticomyces elasticus]KAK4965804.1 hypothetical protein LTR42_011818 [Elasticomyces elasticus]KAK5715988.1 hypothetical protein LTR15_009813 [Elasticomyces elasticus]